MSRQPYSMARMVNTRGLRVGHKRRIFREGTLGTPRTGKRLVGAGRGAECHVSVHEKLARDGRYLQGFLGQWSSCTAPARSHQPWFMNATPRGGRCRETRDDLKEEYTRARPADVPPDSERRPARCRREGTSEPGPPCWPGWVFLKSSEQFLSAGERYVWACTATVAYLDRPVRSTARAGRFTSDSEALVGDHPAVLGVSLGMLALEPTDWNRRGAVAEAMRRHLSQGGVVTMDWHAASCNASTPPGKALATVKVAGRDVAIQAVSGRDVRSTRRTISAAIASRETCPRR